MSEKTPTCRAALSPARIVLLAMGALVWVYGARSAAQQGPVFRTGVDPVNLGVTVTDRKGNLVTDLTADEFEVLEDGKKQTVTYFAKGDGAAGQGPDMHLGLLLDVSESMGDDLAFTKTAAVKFLNTLTDAVDVTVVDFDTEVRVSRYAQREFARLIERIRLQKARGDTALYDAIGVYLQDAAGESGRKIMLLYTDGGDTRSALRYRELLDLLKASDVTVYAIGELDHQSSSGRLEQRLVLQQIADATGGQAFFPTSARELDALYATVLAQIRAQYTLGYQSTNDRADGTWRKVEIRVSRNASKDFRPRARQGYYALYKKP
jgi:Ca-activated chloride channel family protein